MGGGDSSEEDAVRARLEQEQQSHRETLLNFGALQSRLAAEKKSNEVERAHYKYKEDNMNKAMDDLKRNHQAQVNRMQADSKQSKTKFDDEGRKLREKYEEEKKNIEAKLATEKDKRLEDEKAHSGKVEALQIEMREQAEAKNEKIQALQSCNNMLLIAIKEAQIRYSENANRMIGMFTIAHANEKHSTRLNDEKNERLNDISMMENSRRKIRESITRAKMQLKKTGIVPEMDETVELTLKMVENATSLGDKIKSAIEDIEKASSFNRDFVEEVKKHLNNARKGTNVLYKEIVKVSDKMVDSPLSVSLDALEECLEDLREAIDSIPLPPTMKECIEMSRLAIQNEHEAANMRHIAIAAGVETMNNAISSGVETESIDFSADVDPIVEEPP